MLNNVSLINKILILGGFLLFRSVVTEITTNLKKEILKKRIENVFSIYLIYMHKSIIMTLDIFSSVTLFPDNEPLLLFKKGIYNGYKPCS